MPALNNYRTTVDWLIGFIERLSVCLMLAVTNVHVAKVLDIERMSRNQVPALKIIIYYSILNTTRLYIITKGVNPAFD